MGLENRQARPPVSAEKIPEPVTGAACDDQIEKPFQKLQHKSVNHFFLLVIYPILGIAINKTISPQRHKDTEKNLTMAFSAV
jgi:hypothetical protein